MRASSRIFGNSTLSRVALFDKSTGVSNTFNSDHLLDSLRFGACKYFKMRRDPNPERNESGLPHDAKNEFPVDYFFCKRPAEDLNTVCKN